MIAYSEFTPFEKGAVFDHLAALPESELAVDFTHDAVFVRAAFKRAFFSDLHQREIADAVASGGQSLSEIAAMGASDTSTATAGGAGGPAPRKSIAWLLRTIEDIYAFRWKQSTLDAHTHHTRPFPIVDDISVQTFQFLSKRFGVATLVQRAASELLTCIKAYRVVSLEVQLFGVLLSGATYNTDDIEFMLRCRAALQKYVLQRQATFESREASGSFGPQVASVRCVHVRDIPFLLRRCLAEAHRGVHRRARWALRTWCDPKLRFPAVVANPNFYAPPFSPANPYIGRSGAAGEAAAVPDDEARLSAARPNLVVDEAQLLTLLLLNFKQEQIEPTPVPAASRAATPQRAVKRVVRGGVAKSADEEPLLLAETLSLTLRKAAGTSHAVQSSRDGSRPPAKSPKCTTHRKSSSSRPGDATPASPAMQRRTSMHRAATNVDPTLAPELGYRRVVDMPLDFDPFRDTSPSPRRASLAAGRRVPSDDGNDADGQRAVSVPFDLALDIPFVTEEGTETLRGEEHWRGGREGNASTPGKTTSCSVETWASPPSPIAAPHDLHGATLDKGRPRGVSLTQLQDSYAGDVRALEAKLSKVLSSVGQR